MMSKEQQLFREGQGKRQPPKQRASDLWAKSGVDKDEHVYGTRNNLRRVTKQWGGYYLEMVGWDDNQFLGGKGLHREGRFVLYVQQKERGRTNDGNKALGFVRAANHMGLEAQMYDSQATG